MKYDDALLSTMAMKLWSQRGQLLSWEHLGVASRGYDRSVAALSKLLEMGFDIRLSPAGVRMVSPEDTPCSHQVLGKIDIPSVCSPVLDSTNDNAMMLAKAGADHGTIVIAEAQLRGKGRLGHEWFSPAGLGLWFSMILRSKTLLPNPGLMPLMVGLCVGRVVRRIGATDIILKWSNDVLWRRKKLAGILVERLESNIGEAFILGIGINVHHKEEDFPPELRATSIPLDAVLRRSMNRAELIVQLTTEIMDVWSSGHEQGFGNVPNEWAKESGSLGTSVRAGTGREILTGMVKGVNESGELIILLPDGSVRELASARIEIMGD